MAPYAATYPSSSPTNEPVLVTLGYAKHGGDVALVLMDVEETITDQQVQDALKELRNVPMDLDEQPWAEWEGGVDYEGGLVIVVDTNILLRSLSLLKDLLQLISTPLSHAVHRPSILIPRIVVKELDGLKNSAREADSHDLGGRTRASIAVLSRSATTWVLESIAPTDPATHPVVRGQRASETLLSGRKGTTNDELVLDAARYFRDSAKHVVLLSDDKNLRIESVTEGVAASGVEDGMTARQLLAKLDPLFFSAITNTSDTSRTSPRTSPRASPRRSTRATPSPTPRRSLHAGPSPPPSPQRSTSTPIPLSVPPPTDSMELEVDAPSGALLDPPRHPPVHRPVRTPADVYLNCGDILAFFLAHPLFWSVYQYLDEDRPRERGTWQTELGHGWHLWDAKDCVMAVKRWWDDGDIKAICTKGLERVNQDAVTATRTSSPPSPPPPRPSLPTRGTQSSRWATTTNASRTPSPPPPPIVPRSPPNRRAKPLLPTSKRLSNLYSSLPILITAFSISSPTETNTWSAPRWEVFIEGTGALLLAVLGGVRGDVADGVRTVVQEFARELRTVGVMVEVDDCFSF